MGHACSTCWELQLLVEEEEESVCHWVPRFRSFFDAQLIVMKASSRSHLGLGKRGVKKSQRPKLTKIMEVSADEEASDLLVESVAQVYLEHPNFPCCVVWNPLPIVSWLAPFIGHVGICREDGVIMDFAGANLVTVDNFSFGAVARYVRLDKQECCFPPNMSGHSCKSGFRHAELGTSVSWDDALRICTQRFQHKSYNLFTCNCHSFVATCLNRLAYRGSLSWNVVDVALLIIFRGQWVNKKAIIRSFWPFCSVTICGLAVAGWSFLVGMTVFSFLLIGWFLMGTYCIKSLIEY